ncbi:glycosyltransferase [Noviluteimonas dokdonensis]|uniref:glycosyltransferase n=1 Tax=Noviluteimonas dokdonensis TaxID=414050 RepID=UPI001929DE31|nr:glycosyltransferase [Lysobacter dokdonensis]
MNRVAIFRSVLLPPSETFIRDQARALRAWVPTLVGTARAEPGLDLAGLRAALPAGNPAMRRWRQRFGLADAGLSDTFRAHADVVHVHFALDAVDAWPSVQRAGLPMVVTLHGYDITTHASWWRRGHGGWGRITYPGRLVRLFREPRVSFIAVSEAIREDAIRAGLSPDRIVVRHIGIDVEKFRPAGVAAGEREPRVLFVGRLVEKKGVRYLIEAMAKVRAHVPDATLAIVGDGPLRASLAALAADLRIPAEFLGALDDAGIRSELARARTLCLPSVVAANGDAEGFGMVLLEAQASGVPVVTSAKGGATEGVLEGATGLTFPERDVDAMARALTRLLTDNALCDAMSREGPAFVRRTFDIRQLTPALEAIYDHACAGMRPIPGEPR